MGQLFTAAAPIRLVRGRQILDSRGRPTVEADVVLMNGAQGRAAVPSGASVGTAEAWERRDHDPYYYDGYGVLDAVASINTEIANAVHGMDVRDQHALDTRLCELDGTDSLCRLGANAVLAVSMAVCRAAANVEQQPLFQYLAGLAGVSEPLLPMPMVNILSGGQHARGAMDLQDFLIVPAAAATFTEALHMAACVRARATELVAATGAITLLADEGGLSPGFADGKQALELLSKAVEQSGLKPGVDIFFALDVAASELERGHGHYHLHQAGRELDGNEMIAMLRSWSKEFPIVAIEDGLGEEDWQGWQRLTQELGDEVLLIGDDLFTTNRARLAHGVAVNAANSILIKLNQNGTVSGTLEVIADALNYAYMPVVSARSGETADSFIADLAVGTGAGLIKIGSVRNSERLAKYNQLLRIEELYRPGFTGAAVFANRGVTSKGD